MSLSFAPVQIAVGEEGGGLLVFKGKWLIAVLVRLSTTHLCHAGHWFLETGYGRFAEGEQPIFADQGEAMAWFRGKLADQRVSDPWES